MAGGGRFVGYPGGTAAVNKPKVAGRPCVTPCNPSVCYFSTARSRPTLENYTTELLTLSPNSLRYKLLAKPFCHDKKRWWSIIIVRKLIEVMAENEHAIRS